MSADDLPERVIAAGCYDAPSVAFGAQVAADAFVGRLITPEIQAVLDQAVATFRETEDIDRQAWVLPELRDAIVAYLATITKENTP